MLKENKLPIGKQLSQYDFSEVTSVNAQQIKHKTKQLDWLKQRHNILIFSESSLEKTHLASALGYALIEKAKSVKFTISTAIIYELQKAREALVLEDALRKLNKYELLILDDTGYVKK